jgi:phage tail tape-measure protein
MSNAENPKDVVPTDEPQEGWAKETQSNPIGGVAGAAVGAALGVVSGIAAGPVGSLAGAAVGAVLGGLAGSHSLAGAGAPAGAASAEAETASTDPDGPVDTGSAAEENRRLDEPDEAARDTAQAQNDPTRQRS